MPEQTPPPDDKPPTNGNQTLASLLQNANPWTVVLLLIFGGGTGLNLWAHQTEEKYATADDVAKLEAKVDKVETKLDTLSGKLTDLRIVVAQMAAAEGGSSP